MDKQVIKLLMGKLKLDVINNLPADWNDLTDPILDLESYDEPLTKHLYKKGNQFGDDATEKLMQKFPDKVKLRQSIAFQLAQQMEYPGYGTLASDDFDEFVNHPVWLDTLETTSLDDVDSKLSVKDLTVFMTKWNNKKKELHWKSLSKVDQEVSLQNAKEKGFEKSTRTAYSRYLNNQYMGKFLNKRLVARREISQPLIVDMRFSDPKQNKFHNVIDQLQSLHTINKSSADPFRMIHVNLQQDSLFEKKFVAMVKKTDGMEGETFEYTRKSYFDLSPVVSPEEIVYLSPDADEHLEEFNPRSVYVIGALVDSSSSRWLTKTTAYNEKIAVKSLPLKEYLNFGGVTARKDLNLDTVLNILLRLKKTNSWIEALKEVPHRFHRGLSQKGKILCGFDMETISYFQEGEEMYRKHKQDSEPTPTVTVKAFRNNINTYFGRAG